MVQTPFAGLVAAFVAERYAQDPVAATIAGWHEHDARLPDLSAEGWAAREEASARWLARFDSLDPAGLPPEEGTDRELILATLRGERALRPFARWRRQPSLYSDAVTRGAYYSLIRDEPPLAGRLERLALRLADAPRALAAARRNLDPPLVPPEWVALAVETARSGARLLRAEVAPLAAGAPGAAALAGVAAAAAEALERYAEWLERDLRPLARGSFAIGREALELLLRERDLVDLDAAGLLRFGADLYRDTEAALAAAARALGDGDWRDSVDRLRATHPTVDRLVAAYRTEMDRSRQAVVEARVLTLPPGERLIVEAMPDFARTTLPYAAYVQPAPFERSRLGRFWVTLPLPGESRDTVRQRLEGHPRKGIAVIACHEGYPGHHAQLSIAADHPSLARKTLRSNLLIEGWGLYVEELMTEIGHLADPETRLLRTKDLLWRAARVRVDVGLATGELDVAGAAAYLVEGPRLEPPNALAEVRRYTMDPLQPSSYALGRAELLRLRERARARGIALREFHDGVLAAGSLPPRLLAAELGL